MDFQIQGLQAATYDHLFGRADADLAALGVQRHTVTTCPGAPCRISLDDAAVGETVLLLSHRHLDSATPYAQSGPIFIREKPGVAWSSVNSVPPALVVRTLSVRAFSDDAVMIDADLTDGAALPRLIARFFSEPTTAFLHVHFAKRGCFAAAVSRA